MQPLPAIAKFRLTEGRLHPPSGQRMGPAGMSRCDQQGDEGHQVGGEQSIGCDPYRTRRRLESFHPEDSGTDESGKEERETVSDLARVRAEH